jgi:hypothetical protein
MELSAKGLRTIQRAMHVVLGVLLLVIVFTPLGDAAAGGVLRLIAAPLVVVTGILMWQHGRVVRVLREGKLPITIK